MLIERLPLHDNGLGVSVRNHRERVSDYPSPIKYGTSINQTFVGVFTPTFIDYNYKSPYMVQYNASVQQQLPWNMALGVAYVGNRGVHLPMVRDGNPIVPTFFGPCGDPASLCVDGKVPFWDNTSPNYHNVNPNFGSDINVATVAASRYNALQVVLAKTDRPWTGIPRRLHA